MAFWRLARALESGDGKTGLAAWWLALIERRVLDFVAARGLDLGALPYDYIDVQPRSMDALRANLAVLRATMAEACDPASRLRAELVDPLRGEIYARIDAFRDAATLYLRRERAKGGAERAELAALSSDVEYLEEMRRKEPAVLLAQAQQPDPTPDVVPVNGLIMNVLHRLENEHFTALSHWQSRTPSSSPAKRHHR